MVDARGADLHTHTTASDGALTPTELVELAAKSEVLAIAVTDHDTIDGVEEAVRVGRECDLLVIPGVELSTDWESPVQGPQTVHLLGYAPDPAAPALAKTIHEAKFDRELRGEAIVKRLNELGLAIAWERVLEIAGEARIVRPHIARAIMEKGYETSWDRVFERWLGNAAPGYVGRTKLDTRDAVEMVVVAGGVAVVAHPYYDFHDGTLDLENLLPPLIEAGLQGLEVYYGGIDPKEWRQYLEIAATHGLLTTGGSDFHGNDLAPEITVGCAVCPRENLLRLCEMAGISSPDV